MKMPIRAALAALLATLLCAPLAAQTSGVGKNVFVPAGSVPATAISCDNGSGVAIVCSFSGGGGATTYTLLSNASSSGAAVNGVSGGGYIITAGGTFGGATVALQVSDATGTLAASGVSFTAGGSVCVSIGQGSSIRGTVTGGTPSGLYLLAQGITGPCPASSVTVAGTVGGYNAVVGGSFTRPADTTAYASGDLVANSTTAASVVPVAVNAARVAGGSGTILNIRLSKSSATLTNASFRVHLFKGTTSSPFVTTTVGDNGVFAGAVNGIAAIEIGYVDITMDEAFSDGAKGSAAPPSTRNVMIFDTNAVVQTLYALIEARGAYTPASGEAFTVALEVQRD